LAGTDSAYRAAFHQAGIIRVPHIEALFDAAISLANQPLPRGEHVVVLTNSGGPGVLASDALMANGLRLATLTDETRFCLRQFLQPHASVTNPVDMLGGADEHDYARALDALLKDPAWTRLLVINVPQVLVRRCALCAASRKWCTISRRKAEATSGDDVPHRRREPGRSDRVHAPGPVAAVPFPERAVSALAAMLARRKWLEAPRKLLIVDC